MTTEMDSIVRGDNAAEIDCSRGDVHLSGRAVGRTRDSRGTKRQTGPDGFAVSALKGIVSEGEKVLPTCEYLFNYPIIQDPNRWTVLDASPRIR
jgi:hypothetical protein